MHRHTATNRPIISRRTLAFAAISAFLIIDYVASVDALARQSVIHVPGIVRDFRADHPDFNITPSSGYGHYAGNIDLDIGADGRPVFDGDGFKVATEWFNRNAQPIAPHMYQGISPVQLGTPPLMQGGTILDSWDPNLGRYGEDGNVGPAPDILTGSAMPTIILPTNLGPSVGNININGQSNIISTSFRCNNFSIKSNARLRIDGDVTILVDGSFSVQQNAELELMAGARLHLYIVSGFAMFQGAQFNINTLDPNRALVYYSGSQKIDISQFAELCATLVAPNATLELGQEVHYYGSFYGSSIDMRQGSQLHSAGADINDNCGTLIEDTFGVHGTFTPGGITSESTFNEWYNDVLGTNLSMIHTMQMVRNGAGIYEAIFPEFHPIDDRLYGNEGAAHNYYFTYTFNVSFTYEACQDQFFSFAGADDAWMYIDTRLGIDLGGVLPGTSQIVEMDRLNLTDGETYTLHFFYAQRNPNVSSFNMQTNVEVTPMTLLASGTGGYD